MHVVVLVLGVTLSFDVELSVSFAVGVALVDERVLVQDLMFGLTTAVALALFRSKPLGVALMVVLGLGEALSL